jgi:hypothetical protein
MMVLIERTLIENYMVKNRIPVFDIGRDGTRYLAHIESIKRQHSKVSGGISFLPHLDEFHANSTILNKKSPLKLISGLKKHYFLQNHSQHPLANCIFNFRVSVTT